MKVFFLDKDGNCTPYDPDSHWGKFRKFMYYKAPGHEPILVCGDRDEYEYHLEIDRTVRAELPPGSVVRGAGSALVVPRTGEIVGWDWESMRFRVRTPEALQDPIKQALMPAVD